MRYLLTYNETAKEMKSAQSACLFANSDTEAAEQTKGILQNKEVNNVTLWRRGDFVILGREK